MVHIVVIEIIIIIIIVLPVTEESEEYKTQSQKAAYYTAIHGISCYPLFADYFFVALPLIADVVNVCF